VTNATTIQWRWGFQGVLIEQVNLSLLFSSSVSATMWYFL
jgi:hypothetical protein